MSKPFHVLPKCYFAEDNYPATVVYLDLIQCYLRLSYFISGQDLLSIRISFCKHYKKLNKHEFLQMCRRCDILFNIIQYKLQSVILCLIEHKQLIYKHCSSILLRPIANSTLLMRFTRTELGRQFVEGLIDFNIVAHGVNYAIRSQSCNPKINNSRKRPTFDFQSF